MEDDDLPVERHRTDDVREIPCQRHHVDVVRGPDQPVAMRQSVMQI